MILALSLPSVGHLIVAYRYWIIFPLACLEGPLVAFAVGSLTARGAFEVFSAFAVLLLGDLVPDVSLFLIGKRASRSRRLARWADRYEHVGRSARAMHAAWRRHGFRTMFVSKISYGLAAPLMVSAGSSGLSVWRLIAYAIPVTLFQYGVLFALGYYLGSRFKQIESVWRYLGAVAAGVVLVFVLRIAIGHWLERRVDPDSDAHSDSGADSNSDADSDSGADPER